MSLPSAPPGVRWLQAALCLLASLIASAPAGAQQSGRWWWDAGVGVGQRAYENKLDGQTIATDRQGDLRLALGLNGFILHPMIADFRVDLDALAARRDSGRYKNNTFLGFGGSLNLFPQGYLFSHLFVRQRLYDYSFSVDDPVYLSGTPDTVSTLGASFRCRKGLFSGTTFGFDRGVVRFMGPDADRDVRGSEFVDWVRSEARFQHKLSITRRTQDLGAADFGTEDITVQLTENMELGRQWRWSVLGAGFWRETAAPDDSRSFASQQLTNLVSRDFPSQDRLDLAYRASSIEPDGLPRRIAQRTSAIYRWNATSGLVVSPALDYNHLKFNGMESSVPEARVNVDWTRVEGVLDTLLGGALGYGLTDENGHDMSSDHERWSYSTYGTVGHGTVHDLRKELEFSLARNELQVDFSPNPSLPEVEAYSTVDRSDAFRTRVKLRHRWDSSGVGGWLEWKRRESSGGAAPARFVAQGYSGSLQVELRGFHLFLSAGDMTFQQPRQPDQQVRHASAGLNWRAWRKLFLTANYRLDRRAVVLGPDVDGDRVELGAEFDLGRWNLRARYYESSERALTEYERETRGLLWSVTSRFAGWLPIVTGMQRKGVIR